jgi:hypothetical protein
MAVSMQTPIPSYGNFGQTISNSINQAASRVHDAKMQQERINSAEKMQDTALAHNARLHNIDSKIKIGIASGNFSGLGLENDMGNDWLSQANANIQSNPNAAENYNNLSVNDQKIDLGRPTLAGAEQQRSFGARDEMKDLMNVSTGYKMDKDAEVQNRRDFINNMANESKFFTLPWNDNWGTGNMRMQLASMFLNPFSGYSDDQWGYEKLYGDIYDKTNARDDMTILEDEYDRVGVDPRNLNYSESALLNRQIQDNIINPSAPSEVMEMIESTNQGFGDYRADPYMNLMDLINQTR